MPVLVDEARVDEQVDVVTGGEKDDVRGEPGRHGLRLVGGGAVGLREGDAAAVGRRLPGLDDLAQHRLRRRVGDHVDRGGAGSRGGGEGEGEKCQNDADPGHGPPSIDVVHRFCRQDYG